jgi:DNA-binding winged helix-turn-helix (wHTH) protein/TolB-like protein
MSNGINNLRMFGKFRLDAERKVLWIENEPVNLPLKEIELLCVLTENCGQVVTKDELLNQVWAGSFVEESNLSRHIYLLRKTFEELGESADLIQTVPRRGYRFTGEINYPYNSNLIVEKHILTRTLVEEIPENLKPVSPEKDQNQLKSGARNRYLFLTGGILLTLSVLVSIWYLRSNPTVIVKSPVKTITILPFQSLNDKEEERILGLGITESLVSRLGSLEQIIVRPMNSVKQISEHETDPLEIGRKSKADAILTGSFQSVSGRFRMNVRLLRVSDGSQIWAENFDEKETDIFKLQDSLSAQTAKYLIDRLSPREEQKLAARPTENFDAYKLYLRGRNSWAKRTPEGFWESIRSFQAAIDIDPAFALAYAGLADSYVLLNDYNAAPPDEAYPKAKAAAQKALEINPNLVEPRTTIAYVLANYDWNYPAAEREYRWVIEQNPNYATAHQWYGEMLYTTKRFAESEIELKRAAELDPLAPIIQCELGVLRYYEGKYDETISLNGKIRQVFPDFPSSYLFTSWAYERKQMNNEAFAEEIVFWKLQGVDEPILKEMERAFRTEGYTAYMHEIAKMLEKAAQSGHLFHDYRLVHIYGRLRDREKTLEWLEKGIKNHSSGINKVPLDSNFDFLRNDERFQTLEHELEKYQ